MRGLRTAATMVFALCATSASATTFDYTAASGDVVQNFSFTTSLSGAALDNLPPGTLIPFSPFTFQPTGLDTDQAGFALGGAFGSAYFSASGVSVAVGTNSLGQITSWTISENVFASWPAFSGENPNDFFGKYTITLTDTGDTRHLTQDNDLGFAQPDATSGAGSFGAQAIVTPLPGALPLFATGLVGLGLLGWRRRRKAQAA